MVGGMLCKSDKPSIIIIIKAIIVHTYRTSEYQLPTPFIIKYNIMRRDRISFFLLCAAPGKAGEGPPSVSPEAPSFLVDKRDSLHVFLTPQVREPLLIDGSGYSI